MFERQQTAAQLTRSATRRSLGGDMAASSSPTDRARLRAALAQTSSTGLRERMARRRLVSRVA